MSGGSRIEVEEEPYLSWRMNDELGKQLDVCVAVCKRRHNEFWEAGIEEREANLNRG
jgi:hypothetical protein